LGKRKSQKKGNPEETEKSGKMMKISPSREKEDKQAFEEKKIPERDWKTKTSRDCKEGAKSGAISAPVRWFR